MNKDLIYLEDALKIADEVSSRMQHVTQGDFAANQDLQGACAIWTAVAPLGV